MDWLHVFAKKRHSLHEKKELKLGVFRPITFYPYPYDELNKLADQVKGFLTVEMNAGQMVEDVRLAVNGKIPVEFLGRMGGIVPTPEEILHKLEEKFVGETV